MRLPFAPVVAAIGDVYDDARTKLPTARVFNPSQMYSRMQLRKGAPAAMVADLAGVSRRTIHRWQSAGIPEDAADRIAVSLGMHPSELWPEWFSEETA